MTYNRTRTARPANVTDTPVASDAIVPAVFKAPGAARKGRSADWAVTELYSLHYRALVRLAVLLVRDVPTAEDVVQDSFVAVHDGWQRLRNAESALAYLRHTVLNRSRSVLRHRAVVDKHLPNPPPDIPQRRVRRAGEAGAVRGGRGAAQAARPAARGDRAAVLRGLLRSRGRGRDGHQPRRGQKPHRAGHGRAARGPGATGPSVEALARQRGEGLYLFVEDRPHLVELRLRRGHVQGVRLRALGRMQHEEQVEGLLLDPLLVPGELPPGSRRAPDVRRLPCLPACTRGSAGSTAPRCTAPPAACPGRCAG